MPQKAQKARETAGAARTGKYVSPRANTVQISTDGLPPLRNTEQQRSEYSRGEGGEDAEGWALVVARPGPSSINFLLFERYWALVVARPVLFS